MKLNHVFYLATHHTKRYRGNKESDKVCRAGKEALDIERLRE